MHKLVVFENIVLRRIFGIRKRKQEDENYVFRSIAIGTPYGTLL
jgi:hypothetical protein